MRSLSVTNIFTYTLSFLDQFRFYLLNAYGENDDDDDDDDDDDNDDMVGTMFVGDTSSPAKYPNARHQKKMYIREASTCRVEPCRCWPQYSGCDAADA